MVEFRLPPGGGDVDVRDIGESVLVTSLDHEDQGNAGPT